VQTPALHQKLPSAHVVSIDQAGPFGQVRRSVGAVVAGLDVRVGVDHVRVVAMVRSDVVARGARGIEEAAREGDGPTREQRERERSPRRPLSAAHGPLY
jgi:hypothetical protein